MAYRSTAIAVVVGVLVLVTTITATATASSTPSPATAVKMLNQWRAKVGVGPVVENPEMSRGCAKHANYYRLNKEIGHSETQGAPGYTDQGADAAQHSVLAYDNFSLGPFDWEGAIYHRAGVLNPRLVSTGFWSQYKISCMNVFGRSDSVLTPDVTAYPYPYRGQKRVATTFHCNESPNPCDSIPGKLNQDSTTGFILSVFFNGPWSSPAEGAIVTKSSLKPDHGAAVRVLVQDQSVGIGQYLKGGFAMIPINRLKTSTWYTASASGTFDPNPVSASSDDVAAATIPFTVTWRFKTQARDSYSSDGIIDFKLLGRLPAPISRGWQYRAGVLHIKWWHSPGAAKYRTVVRAGGRTFRKTVRGSSAKIRFGYVKHSSLTIQAVSSSGLVSRLNKIKL